MMNLTEKQLECWDYLTDSITRDIGYGGAAGGGKTWEGCCWMMELGELAAGIKMAIGRDSLEELRASVVPTWSKVANSIGYHKWKFYDRGIKFDNGSEIEFLDLGYYPRKDPLFERLGSKEFTVAWIEECAQMHPLAAEMLRTRVGRHLNSEYNILPKIFYTFNPKKNWVYNKFYKPHRDGVMPKGTSFTFATVKDNPHLDDEYIKGLESLSDESTKQRLLYGNFDYDDDPSSLISFDKIKKFFTEVCDDVGGYYITADVARFGSDKTVILVWRGLTVVHCEVIDVATITKQAEAIKELMQTYGIDTKRVVVDQDGVGGGLVDILNCVGFTNGGKAEDSQYSNKKSECGYAFAKDFDSIKWVASIDGFTRDQIEEELGQLKTFKTDDDGRLKLLPKKEIKINIGRSPDFLDALLMRMYWKVIIPFKPSSTYFKSNTLRPSYY